MKGTVYAFTWPVTVIAKNVLTNCRHSLVLFLRQWQKILVYALQFVAQMILNVVGLHPILISPPENDSFRKDLCFVVVFFFFFFSSRNLRAPSADPQKIFRGQKHAKFGPISVDFEVWRRISSERMKMFKIGELLVRQRFLPR